MVKTNHSTISVCVAALTIASAFVFVGTVDVSSMHTTVVGKTANQPVIDVELDELAVSFTRKGPFAFEKVPCSIPELDDKPIQIRDLVYPTYKIASLAEVILNGKSKSRAGGWMAGLDGVSNESPRSLIESVSTPADQQAIDIELDRLFFYHNRDEPFSLELLPEKVRSLENKRIRIPGYMLAFEDTDITAFTLNGEISSEKAISGMNFSNVDFPRHLFYIAVYLRTGKSTEFRHDPIIVEGTVRIEPEMRDGQLLDLFRIENATLAPTKPRDGFQQAFGWPC